MEHLIYFYKKADYNQNINIIEFWRNAAYECIEDLVVLKWWYHDSFILFTKNMHFLNEHILAFLCELKNQVNMRQQLD